MSQNNSTYEDNVYRIYLYYKWDHHITKEKKKNKLYVLNKKDIDKWKSTIKYEEAIKELESKKKGNQIQEKDISEFYKDKKNVFDFPQKINNISLINGISNCKRENGHYINPNFWEGKEIELVNKEVNDIFKTGINAEIEVDYIEKDGKYILAYLDNDESKKLNNEKEKENKKQNETNKKNEEIQIIKNEEQKEINVTKENKNKKE